MDTLQLNNGIVVNIEYTPGFRGRFFIGLDPGWPEEPAAFSIETVFKNGRNIPLDKCNLHKIEQEVQLYIDSDPQRFPAFF